MSVAEPRPFDAPAVRRELLAWHRVHGRDIPFRLTADPWRILVLEVASQQTQLARAVEGAGAFCDRFPSPASLAVAPPSEAIRAWAGMGYNRRGVALHRAAVEIVRRHDGSVPSSLADLEALPGVGPYTARAVAAQAFGVPVGPIDVNVARLLGRLVGDPPLGRRDLQALADAIASVDDPGAWVHVVMDFSALVCTARSPACGRCPVADVCRSAFQVGPRAASIRRPKPSQRFPSTRRWLRGQLVRELRALVGSEWTVVDGRRGEHGESAVREAIAELERDGLIEVGAGGEVRLAEASRM